MELVTNPWGLAVAETFHRGEPALTPHEFNVHAVGVLNMVLAAMTESYRRGRIEEAYQQRRRMGVGATDAHGRKASLPEEK